MPFILIPRFPLCGGQHIKVLLPQPRQSADNFLHVPEAPESPVHALHTEPIVPPPHAEVARRLVVMCHMEARGQRPTRVGPHVTEVVGHKAPELRHEEGHDTEGHVDELQPDETAPERQGHEQECPIAEDQSEGDPALVEQCEWHRPLELLLEHLPRPGGHLRLTVDTRVPMMIGVVEHVDRRRDRPALVTGLDLHRVSVAVECCDGLPARRIAQHHREDQKQKIHWMPPTSVVVPIARFTPEHPCSEAKVNCGQFVLSDRRIYHPLNFLSR